MVLIAAVIIISIRLVQLVLLLLCARSLLSAVLFFLLHSGQLTIVLDARILFTSTFCYYHLRLKIIYLHTLSNNKLLIKANK